MTREYGKVQELNIVSEGLTFIDAGNPYLKAFTTLKKLDLSFNRLTRLEHLDCLPSLRDLNLSYNRLTCLENLSKLPSLRVLVLDHNKLQRLEGLKMLKKLEVLSVTGNLLEDLGIHGGGVAEPMLELRELHAGRNRIQVVKQLQHYPNVRKTFFYLYIGRRNNTEWEPYREGRTGSFQSVPEGDYTDDG